MTAPVTPSQDSLKNQIEEASGQPGNTVIVVSQIPQDTNTETLIAATTYRPNSSAAQTLIQRNNQNTQVVAAAIENRLQTTGDVGNPKLLNYTPSVNALSNIQRSINNAVLPLNSRENLLRGASARTQQLAAQFQDLRKLTELQQKLENITQRLEAQINTAGEVLKRFLNGPDAAASASIGVLISRLEDLEAAYTKVKAVLALVKKAYENTKRAIIKALFEDIPKMLEKIQKTKKTIEKILSVPETPRKIVFPKFPKLPKLAWKKIDLYAKAKKVWETFKKKNSEFRQKAYLKAIEQSGFEIIDPKKDKIQRGLTKARNELREARARLQAAQATRNEAVDRATKQLNKNINQINRNVERERERFTKEFKKLNSNLQKRLAEIGSRKKYLTEVEISSLVNSPTVNVLIKNLYGDLPNTVRGGSLPPEPAPPPPPPTPIIPYPGKIYGRGPGDTARNDANVQRIQQRLNEVLNLTGTNALVIDGIIGPLTDAAIRKFQQSKSLNVDGRVGSITWPALFTPTQSAQPTNPAQLNIASRDDILRLGLGQTPTGPQSVQLLSTDQANKLVDEYLYSRGLSPAVRDSELTGAELRERAVARAEALAKIQSSGLIGQRTSDGREVYKETESGALYVLESAAERLTKLANKTTARLQANIEEITKAGDIVNDAIKATARVGAGFSRQSLRTSFQAELTKEIQTVNNLQELTRSAPSTPPKADSTNPLETTIDPKTLTITTIARRPDATRAINDAADENRIRAEQYGLKGLLTYDAIPPVAKSANGQTIFEVVVKSSYKFTTNAEITRASANAQLAATVKPYTPPINEIVQPPVTYRPNAASVRFRQTPGTTAQNTTLRSLTTADALTLQYTPFVNANGLVWGQYKLISTGEIGWIANNLITPTPQLSTAINAPRTVSQPSTTSTSTAAAAAAGTVGGVAATAATGLYKVVGVRQGDVLNIRTTGSASSAIVSTIPSNATGIQVTGAEVQGWVPVTYQGTSGWVNKRFITPDIAPTTRTQQATTPAAPTTATTRTPSPAPISSTTAGPTASPTAVGGTRTQVTSTVPAERLSQVEKRIVEVDAELRKVADDIRTAIRLGQQASDPDAFGRAETAVNNLKRKETELKTEKTALELEKQKIQKNNPGIKSTTTTSSPATGTTAATTTTTTSGTATTTTSSPTTTTTTTSTSNQTSTQVQQNKKELSSVRSEISKIWLQRNPIENEIELLEDLQDTNEAEFKNKGGQAKLETLYAKRRTLSENLVPLFRSRKILESQIPDSIKYKILDISIPSSNQPRTNKTTVSFQATDGLSVVTSTYELGVLRDKKLAIEVITRQILSNEGLNGQGPQADFNYPGTLTATSSPGTGTTATTTTTTTTRATATPVTRTSATATPGPVTPRSPGSNAPPPQVVPGGDIVALPKLSVFEINALQNRLASPTVSEEEKARIRQILGLNSQIPSDLQLPKDPELEFSQEATRPNLSVSVAGSTAKLTYNAGRQVTNVEYSINNGRTWTLVNPPARSGDIILNNLENGVYAARVQGIKADGTRTAPSQPTAIVVRISEPRIIRTEPESISSVRVYFDDAVSPADISKYQFTTRSDNAVWTDAIGLVPGDKRVVRSPILVFALEENKTYTVRIRALYLDGTPGKISNSATFSTFKTSREGGGVIA